MAYRRANKSAVALIRAVVANADEFAAGPAEVLADIRATGAITLLAMAVALNARGIRTRRGVQWQVSNVSNLLARLG